MGERVTLTAEHEREREILKLRKRALQIRAKDDEDVEIERKYRESHLIEYFSPYPYQQRVFESFREGKKIVIAVASNKIGKTAVSINLVLSVALGYEPWNKADENYPGAVRVNKTYYKPSCINRKPPVRIRITGEDWSKHIGETLIPELKKWALEGSYETRKNNTGQETNWLFRNKSTIEFMTYEQDIKLFESWLGDFWAGDEPPPKPVYSAMSRGLFLSGGVTFLSLTPLKDAWIMDDLILANRPDVAVIDNVSVWDNPFLYDHDINILTDAGIAGDVAKMWLEKQKAICRTDKSLKPVEDELRNLIGDKYDDVFQNLFIHRFASDIDVNERPPRLFGEFKALMGKILKAFSENMHVVEPFQIPPDWIVTCCIDWHPTKEIAVGFYAFDHYERLYVIEEIWQHMSAEDTADEIIRRKLKNNWRWHFEVAIDPLAKGDDKFIKNRYDVEATYPIIERKLSEYGLTLITASKDKESGIKNLENRLVTKNNAPAIFFFNTCKQHIMEAKRWRRDENGTVVKEFDDMLENLYRATLLGIKWTPIKTAVTTEQPSALGWT